MRAKEFAGTLRERIVVEAPLEERSQSGLRVSGWREVARCLAAIEASGSGPEREGMALSAMGRFRAVIRWRAGIRMGQRVTWRGGLFRIRRLTEDPLHPDRITLDLEEWRS